MTLMPLQHRVLIVVPAYNEERCLPLTLAEISKECPWADVVVINDGSRDATVAAAAAFGYPVLSLPFNLGIGGAVQTGFQFAVRNGYDVVVQLDADGQHPPRAVRELVQPVIDGTCDVVIGSRFLKEGAYRQTVLRLLGIGILARLISGILRQRITDPTSGFRAYSREAVRDLAADYPYDYPEPEALLYLHRRKYRLHEIPVRMRARQDGVSSIGLAMGGKYMFKVVLAILASLLRPLEHPPHHPPEGPADGMPRQVVQERRTGFERIW